MSIVFLVLHLLVVLSTLHWVEPTSSKAPHVVCTLSETESCSMSDNKFRVGNTTEVFTFDPSTRCVESSDPYSFSFTKRDSDKLHITFQV